MSGAKDTEARLWLAVTALLYVVAAVRWPGYLHPDEHFQTLEAAGALLGAVSEDALPWEFGARIRPYLQPMLYAGVGLVFDPERPFTFALACRLLSAALAWLGVAMLGARYRDWFPDPALRRWVWVATATFYLFPFLRVRTSSENLSGALLMMALGLCAQLASRPRRELLAGLLLGLAFTARYQLGFMVAGLLLWHALVVRDRRRWLALAAGALAAVGLGLALDRVGYGAWQLTPWRYVHENLIVGRAASFGEAPWWAHIGYIWHDLPLPFSAMLILALPLAALRAPRHPLVWVCLPFVLGHLAVGHKEPRFLHPFLFLAPPLVGVAFGELLTRLPRPVTAALLVVNLWWLAVDRQPPLRGGPWLETLADSGLPLAHGGEDPFGRGGLHTALYSRGRRSTARPANVVATGETPTLYYHYQRKRSAVPASLEARCERVQVSPWPWAVLPEAWLTASWGRRLFAAQDRHAVYRCPK